MPNQTKGFCTSCKRLNISLSRFIQHTKADDDLYPNDQLYSLGTLKEIRKNYFSCHLCRLLFDTCVTGPLGNTISHTNLENVTISGIWTHALGRSKQQRPESAAVCLRVWVESPQIPPGTFKIVIRAVTSTFSDQPYFGRISPVDSLPLDFELIKIWLKCCEKRHTSCYKGIENSAKPTKNFFVIDVKARCIVAAPQHCRYFALSYVWGDSMQLQLCENNFNTLTRKNGLQEEYLTKTIRDAMKLTERLGERYLWVDSLCIIQDSDLVRQQSIQDMDRIYADSLLTIVAGTCKSANDPLPGVTEWRIWNQSYEEVSSDLTLLAQFDFKDLMENTAYSERAWTFQEYQLSSRLLIFTPNGQVYFSCKEAVYSEDVIFGKDMEPDAAMLEGAELSKLRPQPNSLWTTYRRGVESFTGRKMKYDGDVLNAFSGILRSICGERSLEGIPVSIFNLALLWQPTERPRRRVGFCSWSWAGWSSKVHWLDDPGLNNSQGRCETKKERVDAWIKSRSWIVWYSSWGASTKSPAYLTDGPPWLCGSAPEDEVQSQRFPRQPRNFTPSRFVLGRRLDRLEPQRRNIRYLQFWTISAYFEIEPATSAITKDDNLHPENIGDGLRLFILRDRQARTCGWVLLDEEWEDLYTKQDVRLQEFILLSESSLKYDLCVGEKLVGHSLRHNTQAYNAMMITCTGGISERAGVGSVVKEALSTSCARPKRWKEILLG